jgi:hypothetical protein
MYKDYKLVQAHARDCRREAERARLTRAARQNLGSLGPTAKNTLFFRRVVAAVGTAFIVLLVACGQSPVLEMTLGPQDFGTPQDDFGTSVVANSQGVFVAGWTGGSLDGTNQGGFDAFVRRYEGGKVWGKQFGTVVNDHSYFIALDSAGNSYMLGETAGALVGMSFGGSDV